MQTSFYFVKEYPPALSYSFHNIILMNKNYLLLLCGLLLCNSFISYGQLPQIIITIAGNGYGTGTPVGGYSGDSGPATAAMLNYPSGVTLDDSNNLYIADTHNNRIRKTTLANAINATGTISTVFGIGTIGFSGDNGPATTAQLNRPADICRDKFGNFYIADENNYRIRMVSTAGVINTIAGNGINGYSGDGGSATNAKIGTIEQISVDVLGNIYIGDQAAQRIRKVNSAGIITTIAGNGTAGYSGDGGPATAAELNWPRGTCTDRKGNLYSADIYNNRIRKVDTSGIITTFAGIGGISTYSGDGGLATLAHLGYPSDVDVDSLGNIYISDFDNFVVRKVDTLGIITTVAGDGLQGYSGDGCAATSAQVHYTYGLTTDGSKFLYIADEENHRIRRVGPDHPPLFTHGHNQNLTVCAGVTGSIDTFLAVIDSDAGQQETWTAVASPVHGTVVASYVTTSTGDTLLPVGLSYTASSTYSGNDSFKISVYDCVYMADTTTIHVTVNPLPNVGTITGSSGVCVGAVITLTDLTVGGAWSSSLPGIATVGSTGIVRGVATGTATISYSATNSCGTVAVTKIIMVSSTSAGSISGPSVVCPSNTIPLTDSISGGVWVCSNSHASVTSGGLVSGISTGIDTISYSVTNSCGSATATHIVTVQPLPAVGGITGTSSVCAGTTSSLTDTTGSGVWVSDAPGIATVSATGLVSGVSGGLATISYSVTNSCGTAVATHPVTVNPLPAPGVIAGLSMVCVGATITLSDSPAGGVWSAANDNANISGTTVRGISAGIDTISYTLTNLCGSVPAIKVVTVNPLPSAGVITGSFAIHLCIGSTISLSDAAPGGIWSSSNARASVSAGTVTGFSQGRDTIYYTVTNSCGTAAVSHVVSVNPTPHAGVINGPSFLCAGNTIVLTDTSMGGVWGSKDTLIASINGLGSLVGLSAGTDTVIYTVTDTLCFATAIKVITVNPLPDSGIITTSLINAFCVGDTTTLRDSAADGTWSIANAYAVLAGNVLAALSPGADTVYYTVTNSCGTAVAKYAVNISYMPPIRGNLALCVGDTTYLSDSLSGGRWSGGGSHVYIDGNTLDQGVTAGLSAGTAIITYQMVPGCATYATVTVDPLPDPGYINGTSEICTGLTTLLTDSIANGKWSSNNAAATINRSGEVHAASAAGTALITYTVKNGATGCMGVALFTLNVVSPAFHISDSLTQPMCYRGTDGAIAVSVAGSNGPYQYSWASGDTLSAISNIGVGSYTLIVKDLSSLCVETDTFRITAPDSLTVTAEVKNDYCKENKGSITVTVSGGTAAYSYLWSNKSTTSELSDLAAGTYTLTVTDNNGCLKTLVVALADSNCDGVTIHDAISPNGDGINDTWVIEGLQSYPGNTVQIFDKWGAEVFSETNYKNDWSGTNKNSLLPDGTYYYLVKLNSDSTIAGGKNSFTGSLMIKR